MSQVVDDIRAMKHDLDRAMCMSVLVGWGFSKGDAELEIARAERELADEQMASDRQQP
jgi:hypothetical protein